VQVFLDEKRFEGCAGLQLTDEIRLTIATQACLLLLHRKTNYYPRLLTILVYPSGYVVEKNHLWTILIWEQGREGRLGETARSMGSMVLAWDAARSGALDPSDGKNLVLHEFAHQLDFEDFAADGMPALVSRHDKRSWAEVMKVEFAALRAADATGIPTLLDSYGATNPAEFFAGRDRGLFRTAARVATAASSALPRAAAILPARPRPLIPANRPPELCLGRSHSGPRADPARGFAARRYKPGFPSTDIHPLSTGHQSNRPAARQPSIM
jgi:Mlc titration factor MtfA (ptsG expression regulator)